MRAFLWTAGLLAITASSAHAQGFSLKLKPKGDGSGAVPCIDPTQPGCDGTVIGTGDAPGQIPDDSRLIAFRGGLLTATLTTPGGPGLGGFFTRGVLNAPQAFGAGFQGAFTDWPQLSSGNPGQMGDFTGMVFPFRDFMNFNIPQTITPGGFDASPDNGAISADGSTISGIMGQQDFMSYGARGNPGFGNQLDAVNLFRYEFIATDFTPRTILLQFSAASADFLTPTGQVITVPVEGGSTEIMIIPGPSSLAAIALGAMLTARRRRR